MNGRNEYGCGWHRDRGEAVCANGMRVSRVALEDRILGAVRERILVPENVLYVVESALERVRNQLTAYDPERDRRRLAQLEVQIERAVDLAIETGGLAAAKRKLQALENERVEVESRLATQPRVPDLASLRPMIEAKVDELRTTLLGAPLQARRGFSALLGDRRMVVHADAERGFRVEGLFRWSLENEHARRLQTSGRLDKVVAGEGFEPPTSGL